MSAGGDGPVGNGPSEEELVGVGRVFPSGPRTADGEPDLATTYLGLELPSPVVASSGPITGNLASLEALAAAGVGAVVLPSLFEEQIEHEAAEAERFLGLASGVNPEAPFGYAPVVDHSQVSARYLKLLRSAKEALDVPVIASLNGLTRGGWTEYARMLAYAGADAIELNVYRVAAGPGVSGRDVEEETLALVSEVVGTCDLPVAVKLSPYWSALGSFARELVAAGASGLVLFNRFYQPDIDLERLSITAQLDLSSPEELRLPLRWMASMHGRLDASLAATTGIHAPSDVVKVLLAGADVAMVASVLMLRGTDHVRTLVGGLSAWMEEHGYASVDQVVGAMSQASVADPAQFERAHYLDALARSSGTFVM